MESSTCLSSVPGKVAREVGLVMGGGWREGCLEHLMGMIHLAGLVEEVDK